MSDRVIYYYERQLTSQVNAIEHIESQSLNGRHSRALAERPGSEPMAESAT